MKFMTSWAALFSVAVVVGEVPWHLWLPIVLELAALLFFVGQTFGRLKALAHDVAEIKGIVSAGSHQLVDHEARLKALERSH